MANTGAIQPAYVPPGVASPQPAYMPQTGVPASPASTQRYSHHSLLKINLWFRHSLSSHCRIISPQSSRFYTNNHDKADRHSMDVFLDLSGCIYFSDFVWIRDFVGLMCLSVMLYKAVRDLKVDLVTSSHIVSFPRAASYTVATCYSDDSDIRRLIVDPDFLQREGMGLSVGCLT